MDVLGCRSIEFIPRSNTWIGKVTRICEWKTRWISNARINYHRGRKQVRVSSFDSFRLRPTFRSRDEYARVEIGTARIGRDRSQREEEARKGVEEESRRRRGRERER